MSQTKLEDFTNLLDLGPVKVVFDPRRPGVLVPDFLRTGYSLGLSFGERGADKVQATAFGVGERLDIRGKRVWCFVSWQSVYQLLPHGEGVPVLYPSEIPAEARLNLDGVTAEQAAFYAAPRVEVRLGSPQPVTAADFEEPYTEIDHSQPSLLDDVEEQPRPRPALRLVKPEEGES